MAVHKLLVDDFEDANYALSSHPLRRIEDYRLAYFLNQTLATTAGAHRRRFGLYNV